MHAQTAARFDDILAHVTLTGGRVAGTAVCPQYGARPEYGTRGISHPRKPKRAGACGRPPNKPTAASGRREDGEVVWSSDGAPFAHPVSCLV